MTGEWEVGTKMGCNAWNHPADCDCGWGGDTGSYGVGNSYLKVAAQSGKIPLGLDSLLNPNARCPVCGESVYFFQSADGGRVYFDDVGKPWPKHPCTDNGTVKIDAFEDLYRFTGDDMEPHRAIELATDLVRHAMKDFRSPKRDWFDEQTAEARSSLIDWMFRQHDTGGDHIVPLSEFLQIVEYIEKRSSVWLSLTESIRDIDDITGKRASEDDLLKHKEDIAKYKATIALMQQIRAHYERESFAAASGVRLVED